MEKYVLKVESSKYLSVFINEIRNEVLDYRNNYQKIILFLDPQTELAELKFECYDENSDFKEIYGGANCDIFSSVIELFQWTTSSTDFSLLDFDAIEQIRKFLAEHFTLFLPTYKNEVDYCYAIIELEE